MTPMHKRPVFFLESTGMNIGGWTTGILFCARDRIDRYVLPMPVSADDKHIFLLTDELTQLSALVCKTLVGVVVVFAFPDSTHKHPLTTSPITKIEIKTLLNFLSICLPYYYLSPMPY